MQKTILSFSLILSSFIAIANNNNPKISFIENKGQISDQNYKPCPDVLYSGTDGELVYHIKNTGISYQLNRVDTWIEKQRIRGFSEIQKYPDKTTTYRVDVNWKNANIVSETITDEALQGLSNYYLAVCPDGVFNVKSYKGVTLKNVYANIDIHYYEMQGSLKHDYIVAPNTDYKQIALEIKGATLQYAEDGGVILNTPMGDIKEGAPLVFQNGKQLKAKWIISGDVLSFDITGYNKNQELIIDPLTRVFGTYCGGSGNDQGQSVMADASGNSYLYGHTESSNLLSTTGAHQTTFGGGGFDVFLVKFNSTGTRVWGTYIGGSGGDVASTAVIDVTGNIYISGETSSSNAIATAGTQQQTPAGGNDAFIVKFNSSGVRTWGTYYGGPGADSGKNLALAPDGSFIVIAGETSSATGMVAGGGGGQAFGGGAWDAFVAKFSTAGLRLWGTYYGGSVLDDGYACTADIAGNVYLLGLTESSGNIASSNAYQPTMNGARDAFFVKFNTNGARQWGTYFGGTGIEVATAASSDAAGNLYFCGWTTSGSNISTNGTQQTVYAGGSDDSFIEKFKTNGTRVWGTYLGGSGYDHINGCVADSAYVYVTGGTTSSGAGIFASTDGFQTTYAGGTQGDVFLIKYDTTGTRKWGTYYGGSASEDALSCAVDNQGNAYIGGITSSSASIATAGTHQTTKTGTTDAFLVKFNYSTSVSIEENNFGIMLNAFPNPTTGEIKIDLDKLYENIVVKVYNLAGQLIMEKKINSLQSITFDIEGANGVYFLEIQTSEAKIGRLKVIKK